MYQQNTKSATTAGLLGIFLGAFGAHNWYLGEKNKGIAHVCLASAGILVEIIANLVLPNVLSFSAWLTMLSILGAISGLAGLAISASAIWGLVEGIQILIGGDAGLAAKGYAVATPVAPQNFNQQNYYNQPQNFNPPMQSQGYYGQPVQPQTPQQFNQPGNQETQMNQGANNGQQ